jgi:predicted CXXCH cytochrome family protein
MKNAHPFGTGAIACGSCHNPHASEQTKLIRNEPHEVFGTCGRCHEAGGKLLARADELCVRCHSEVEKEAAAPDAHPALEKGCLSCHTPHAADRPGLIKGASDRAACLTCHTEIRERQQASFSVHPETGAAGACSSCHVGHRSDQRFLLKAAPEKVCESCHKGHAQFGHPIGKGVIDPRTGRDTTCASCHSPHGTGFPTLLSHSPQRSLCVQCHSDQGGPTGGAGHGATGGGG